MASPIFAEKGGCFECLAFLDKGSFLKNENKHVPIPGELVTGPGCDLRIRGF